MKRVSKNLFGESEEREEKNLDNLLSDLVNWILQKKCLKYPLKLEESIKDYAINHHKCKFRKFKKKTDCTAFENSVFLFSIFNKVKA